VLASWNDWTYWLQPLQQCAIFLMNWYCLLRKTQGAVGLPAIQRGELKHLVELRKFSMKCVPYSSPLTLRIALETSIWAWAYFIDFENRLLETWAYGMLLDIVPFEQLVKDGVEKYVTSVKRYEKVASRKGRMKTRKIERKDEIVSA
jgi:hypothetical protein